MEQKGDEDSRKELDVDSFSIQGGRPRLPPRPPPRQSLSGSLTSVHHGSRPTLQSKATTALSSIDIQTVSFPDGSRGTFSMHVSGLTSTSEGGQPEMDNASIKYPQNPYEGNDDTSLRSYAQVSRAAGDLNSLLGTGSEVQSPAWKLLTGQADSVYPFESIMMDDDDRLDRFPEEFDELEPVNYEKGNEDLLLVQWKSKLKHYLILSSAGKPIWSRHGDQNLINGYIGIIQTIISFYEDGKDSLRGFTADDTRIVVMTEGPLYLVAISRLGESDGQLRVQLHALYTQILSTLTLPTLLNLFSKRPSTDLRRPLQGTEPLLASLADTFTKGSASSLLSALECLKLRKSQRQLINNTLLRTRTNSLLYGLIVAGGRLVSVARPKMHSLHPSDLQLIFNMLFEAGGVQAGGGENWIPLCLPGFNNKGYLYMYVSFLSTQEKAPSPATRPTTTRDTGRDNEIAFLLISAQKESFFELKQMRDDLLEQLVKNGSMDVIKNAVRRGRYTVADASPGTQLTHFLYKSRENVQFTMPTLVPHFSSLKSRRMLLSTYQDLHAAAHAKHTHLKILHCLNKHSVSLAWITNGFEFYCMAGPKTSRTSLTHGAHSIIQWVKREEERVFIIGGAVF